MAFGAPLALLLGLAGLAILWIARHGRAPRIAVPSLLFFPAATSSPARAARVPPPAAWCAAAACVLASVAAARPFLGSPAETWWVFDASASMAWRDTSGRSRLERAKEAALARLAALRGDTRVHFRAIPGKWVIGSPAELRPVAAALAVSAAAEEAGGAFLELGPSASGLWFTGSTAAAPARFEAIRIGAVGENLGILALLDAAGAEPPRVVVGNAGNGARELEIECAGSLVRASLPPGGSRAVPIPTIGAGPVRVRAADGKGDACALDDEARPRAKGLRVELDGAAPPALQRALSAFAASKGESSGASPVLAVVPLGAAAAEPASARLEFARPGTGAAALPLRAPAWAPGLAISQLSLPKEIGAAAVDAEEKWVVDARDPSAALAGRRGTVARLGLDPTDRGFTASATFPILVSALADAALEAAAPPGPPGPAVTMDRGCAEDRVDPARDGEPAAAPARREIASPLALAAAVSALAAALLARRRRAAGRGWVVEGKP